MGGDLSLVDQGVAGRGLLGEHLQNGRVVVGPSFSGLDDLKQGSGLGDFLGDIAG